MAGVAWVLLAELTAGVMAGSPHDPEGQASAGLDVEDDEGRLDRRRGRPTNTARIRQAGVPK
ncbi:hypothetical protein [Micromonospora sp. NPDC050276]|uniref:hypothetical protein n=1 Tax=Micromonospora sp. NPDC050276 TaxID=3364278 RepID=UPI00378F89C6